MQKEKDKTYYESEMLKLKVKECNYTVSVKFSSELGETKNLNLNADSVDVFIKFIKQFKGV